MPIKGSSQAQPSNHMQVSSAQVEVVVCGRLMVMVMPSVTVRMTMGSSVTAVVRLAQDQRANDVDQQTQHRHRHGFLVTNGLRSKIAFHRHHHRGRRHTQ